MRKSNFSISIISMASAALILGGCVSRGNNPGWEYAPDMYYSKGYEPFSQGDSHQYNPYGMNMREPVKGSVAWGKEEYYYAYDNTAEGYEAAGKELNYPKDLSDPHGDGKRNYGIYCAPCHGNTGENDGPVFKNQYGSKIKPAWANYKAKEIAELPVGKIFHTLTYGKGNMGSIAPVLSPTDRWRIVKYVKELSGGVVELAKGEKLSDANDQEKLEGLIAGIEFETGSDKLTANASNAMNQLAELLKKYNDYTVNISGHTDNAGKSEANMELSKKRAAAVVSFLVSRGIATARLRSEGLGDTKPVADNSSETGRAKNRRVEFEFKKSN